MVKSMYEVAHTDIAAYLGDCAHAKRLSKMDIQKDIDFCFQKDKYKVIPIYQEGKLVTL